MDGRTGARNHRIKDKTERVHFRVSPHTMDVIQKRCEELNVKKSKYIANKIISRTVFFKVETLNNSADIVMKSATSLLKLVGITGREIYSVKRETEREYKKKMENQINSVNNEITERVTVEPNGNVFSIQMRVSPKEYNDIKENAQAMKMSLADYLNYMTRLEAAGVFDRLEEIEKKLTSLNSLITLLSAQIKEENKKDKE